MLVRSLAFSGWRTQSRRFAGHAPPTLGSAQAWSFVPVVSASLTSLPPCPAPATERSGGYAAAGGTLRSRREDSVTSGGGAPEAVPPAEAPATLGEQTSGAGSNSGSSGGNGSNSCGSGGGGGGKGSDSSKDTYSSRILTALLLVAGTVLAGWMVGLIEPGRTASTALGVAAERTRSGQHEIAQWGQHEETVRSFHKRRVAAVKQRLRDTQDPSNRPQMGKGDLAGRLERPAAMAVLKGAMGAGLHVVCGNTGDGKSTLVQMLEAQHPWVIRVDLRKDSLDLAVRAVAEAMGYSLALTVEEVDAKVAGFTLPEFPAVLGKEEFRQLLLDFEKACGELRDEGGLMDGRSARVPVLILDHANRPLATQAGATDLMYTTVELGKSMANSHLASVVMVTSDTAREHEAWTRAGGRDMLHFVRLPPLTSAEADTLMAAIIYRKLHPAQPPPDAAQLKAVAGAYSSTLEFVRLALGTRVVWLDQLFRKWRFIPLTDEELAGGKGTAIDPAYFSLLPGEFRDPSRRVDPVIWEQFLAMATRRTAVLSTVLEGSRPTNSGRPPSGLAEPGANRLAQRVLATHAALRYMLAITDADASAQETYMSVREKFFQGRSEDLRALCAAGVLYYDHKLRALEMESTLMRRVVEAELADPLHVHRVDLLRKLQELQAAKAPLAEAKGALELRKGVDFDEAAKMALSTASSSHSAAQESVKRLETEVAALRVKLAPHSLVAERDATQKATAKGSTVTL